MLERALKDIHFNPDPKKSAKQQALEVRQPVSLTAVSCSLQRMLCEAMSAAGMQDTGVAVGQGMLGLSLNLNPGHVLVVR